jgi:uncharacterized protein with HEPN domain
MNPRDRVRLQHLADALNSAIRFARGRERGDLDTDEMLLFALVRAVEIAGEAASQVTVETRARLPDLPWASLIGMRNRLVHAYFDINRDIHCMSRSRNARVARAPGFTSGVVHALLL